ncbi:acyl-CoA thioesterase [Agrococcus sediminis]|jgi:acyl-CoA thioester hydrolase|uniref:Acyl-CoA thioesterase n=1 Tax=Agrococcus sediminis TaxID=2599924 RepID=A0A5M8QHS1_9MICO|nr:MULTISPECIES: thioesterase family protein [Agrococcus]KAA6433902.1 acyl-CoA thioesterase [Agrococcus sediminis]MDR7234444.1 acyl-CoA thioester hydrolase [Agrococcus sp. BE272]RWR16068.1 acyl-CoA thioesterase [Agrococcus lahaulensis]UOW00668.1 acyl-CoA thioesterase [Agrococcus sp. SCSIO52902]
MRLAVPVRVRWSDLDAYGHVNNAALLTLLEEARVSAFWAGGPEGSPTTAIIDAGPGATSVTVIARQEAEYLGQIPHHREPIVVDIWVGQLGGASMQVCYEVLSPDRSEVYARAATTVVMLDASTGRPRRLSDAEREAWAPYVEAPVEFRRG